MTDGPEYTDRHWRQVEQLSPVEDVGGDSDGWWARYAASLARSLTPDATNVVGVDSRYILTHGVLGAGPAGAETWPSSRTRSGVVMGAVQSGKTASMLGVAALALDEGVDVLVILAGTRTALWRQTYDRLVEQLVGGQLAPAPHVLRPTPVVVSASDHGATTPSELYQLAGARARRSLSERTPIVMVVMKHGQHLHSAAKVLHERVYPELDRPAHVLVLDDEADDGSILDAVVERDRDPAHDAFKQIPRHIVDLWSRRDQAGSTASPHLHATYVGYTATPQANLLQSDQNPLAPRDFIVALRTPAAEGAVEPRGTTFRERRGLRSYYTGGEVFYRHLDGPGALVVPHEPGDTETGEELQGDLTEQDQLGDALRAYLVAGAVRLRRDPRGRRPSLARAGSFRTEDEVEAVTPAPHTMLFHPAAAVASHFAAAADVLAWTDGLDLAEARDAVEEGLRAFDADALAHRLDAEEDLWRRWVELYWQSAMAVGQDYGQSAVGAEPSDSDWAAIRSLLVDEIFPHVKLAIVNSDPDADDRPSFAPTRDPDSEQWSAPRDLLTIFVSGIVMARGLTLEGMTTTLFLRSSGDPAADTQMQMQRWFGYRGGYIDLCRVFLPASQLQLFREYHETDEALRQQLVHAMNQSGSVAPSPMVIEGARFRATAKIANVSKVPLCPGPTPFVNLVNDGAAPDLNVAVVAELFRGPSDLVVVGVPRGRILHRSLTLVETAELLERLTYDAYAPDPDDPLSQRWSSLSAQLSLGDTSAASFAPLFRPPVVTQGGPVPQVVSPKRCPYAIAAYLRLWGACLSRRARGLFPTDDGSTPWASLNLQAKAHEQPRFNVGIRFGEGAPSSLDPALKALPFSFPTMERTIQDGVITSAWGSRNPGGSASAYQGDQYFDLAARGEPPMVTTSEGGPSWRSAGADGMVLFHVVKAADRPFPVVAVGLAVPLGGPDHFAARSSR